MSEEEQDKFKSADRKRKSVFKSISVKEAKKERESMREKALSPPNSASMTNTKKANKKSKVRKKKRKLPPDSSKNWAHKTEESQIKSDSLNKQSSLAVPKSTGPTRITSSQKASLTNMFSKTILEGKSKSDKKTDLIGRLQLVPSSTRKSRPKSRTASGLVSDRTYSAMIREAGETPDLSKLDNASMEEFTTMKTFFIVRKYMGEDSQLYEEEVTRNVAITKVVITEQVAKRQVKELRDEIPPEAMTQAFACIDTFGVPKSTLAEIAAREPSAVGTFEFPPGMSPGDRSPSVLGASQRPSAQILGDIARESSQVAGGVAEQLAREPSGAGGPSSKEMAIGLAREPSATASKTASLSDLVRGASAAASKGGGLDLDISTLREPSTTMKSDIQGGASQLAREPSAGGSATDASGMAAMGLAREGSAAAPEFDLSGLAREPLAAMTEEMKIIAKMRKMVGSGKGLIASTGEMINIATGKAMVSDGFDNLAREPSGTTQPDYFEEISERKCLGDSSAMPMGVQAGMTDRFGTVSQGRLVAAAAREPSAGGAGFGFEGAKREGSIGDIKFDGSAAGGASDAKFGLGFDLAREASQAGGGPGTELAREPSAAAPGEVGAGASMPGIGLAREGSAAGGPGGGSSDAEFGFGIDLSREGSGMRAPGREPTFGDFKGQSGPGDTSSATQLAREPSAAPEGASADASGMASMGLAREGSVDGKGPAFGLDVSGVAGAGYLGREGSGPMGAGPSDMLGREPSAAPGGGPSHGKFGIGIDLNREASGAGSGLLGPKSDLAREGSAAGEGVGLGMELTGVGGTGYLGREGSGPMGGGASGMLGREPSAAPGGGAASALQLAREGSGAGSGDFKFGASLDREASGAGGAGPSNAKFGLGIDLSREGLGMGAPGREPTFGDFKGQGGPGDTSSATQLAREPSAAAMAPPGVAPPGREQTEVLAINLPTIALDLQREASLSGKDPGGTDLAREGSAAGAGVGAEFGGPGPSGYLGREISMPTVSLTGLAGATPSELNREFDPLAREPSAAGKAADGGAPWALGREASGAGKDAKISFDLGREPSAAAGGPSDAKFGMGADLGREVSAAGGPSDAKFGLGIDLSREGSGMDGGPSGIVGREPSAAPGGGSGVGADGKAMGMGAGVLGRELLTSETGLFGPKSDLAREDSGAGGPAFNLEGLAPGGGLAREASAAGGPTREPTFGDFQDKAGGKTPGGTELAREPSAAAFKDLQLQGDGSTGSMFPNGSGAEREASGALGFFGTPMPRDTSMDCMSSEAYDASTELGREASSSKGPGDFKFDATLGREASGSEAKGGADMTGREPSAIGSNVFDLSLVREASSAPDGSGAVGRSDSGMPSYETSREPLHAAKELILMKVKHELGREPSVMATKSLPDYDIGAEHKELVMIMKRRSPSGTPSSGAQMLTPTAVARDPSLADGAGLHKELVAIKIKSAPIGRESSTRPKSAGMFEHIAREPSVHSPLGLVDVQVAKTARRKELMVLKVRSGGVKREPSLTPAAAEATLSAYAMARESPKHGKQRVVLKVKSGRPSYPEGELQLGREPSVLPGMALPDDQLAQPGTSVTIGIVPSMDREMSLPSKKELVMVKVKSLDRREPSLAKTTTPEMAMVAAAGRESSGKELVMVKIKSVKAPVGFGESEMQLGREPSVLPYGALPDFEAKELTLVKMKSAGLVKSAQVVPHAAAREPSDLSAAAFLGQKPAAPGREPSMSVAPPLALPQSGVGPVLTLMKIKSAVAGRPKSMAYSPGLLREPSLIKSDGGVVQEKPPKSLPATGRAPSHLAQSEPSREPSIVGVTHLPDVAPSGSYKTITDYYGMGAKPVLREPVAATKSLGATMDFKLSTMKVTDLQGEPSAGKGLAGFALTPDMIAPDGSLAREPSGAGRAPSFVPFSVSLTQALARGERGVIPGHDTWRQQSALASIGMAQPTELGREASLGGGPSFQAFDQGAQGSMALSRDAAAMLAATPSDSTLRELAREGSATAPGPKGSGVMLGEDAWREQSGLAGIGMGLAAELAREASAAAAPAAGPSALGREASGAAPPGGGGKAQDQIAREASEAGAPLGAQTSDSTLREPSATAGFAVPDGIGVFKRESTQMFKTSDLEREGSAAGPAGIPEGLGREPSAAGAKISPSQLGLEGSAAAPDFSGAGPAREPSGGVAGALAREASAAGAGPSGAAFAIGDTIREGSLLGATPSLPGRAASARDPSGMAFIPVEAGREAGSLTMVGTVPPSPQEMLSLAREGSGAGGKGTGAEPRGFLQTPMPSDASMIRMDSLAMMREPSASGSPSSGAYATDASSQAASMGLGREASQQPFPVGMVPEGPGREGSAGPSDGLGREASLGGVGLIPSTALMREPSSFGEALAAASGLPLTTPLAREASGLPGQAEGGPAGGPQDLKRQASQPTTFGMFEDLSTMGAVALAREASGLGAVDWKGKGLAKEDTTALAREASAAGPKFGVLKSQGPLETGLSREASGAVGKMGKMDSFVSPCPSSPYQAAYPELEREPSATGKAKDDAGLSEMLSRQYGGSLSFVPFEKDSAQNALSLSREVSGFPLTPAESESTLREPSDMKGIKTPPRRAPSGALGGGPQLGREASDQPKISFDFGREPSGLGREGFAGGGLDGKVTELQRQASAGGKGPDGGPSQLGREASSGAMDQSGSASMGLAREASADLGKAAEGPLGREQSITGMVEPSIYDGFLGTPMPGSMTRMASDATGLEPTGLAREASAGVVPAGGPSALGREASGAVPGVVPSDLGREASAAGPPTGGPSALGREASAGGGAPAGPEQLAREALGAMPGAVPSDLGREASGAGPLPPAVEALARQASLGSLGTDSVLSLSKLSMFETSLQQDQIAKAMEGVADATSVESHAPVIIFRPTIVIVQNNIVIAADLLQKLLAQHQLQQQQQDPANAAAEPSSLVTVQNQEIFIYPNKIEASSMAATYTHNPSDPKPFLNFQS